MARRSRPPSLSKAWQRGVRAITRQVALVVKTAARSAARKAATVKTTTTAKGAQAKSTAPGRSPRPPSADAGDWLAGVATAAAGMRRFRLYRPAGIAAGERLPLLVMLHGCGQDAAGFSRSTRMNRLAARERFLVLYPEQSRLANPQRCWNWFETESGRAQGEAALILAAIDQVCLLYPADRDRVAIAGLSAGGSMAALLATRHPDRFKAVAIHSGVPPGLAHSTATALRAMQGRFASSPSPDARPLPPLLVLHGTKDHVVVPSNAAEAARQWARAAATTTERSRSAQRGRRHPMTVTDFKRGAAIAATLVEIDGLGHAWSGGAAKESFSDAGGPDASTMIWRFVAKRFVT
ncbi:phospholipase [Roseateles aquatilis]|uniref:Phospholipase n=1 Tax=Roseateles aquatilis TaxID=431061 RepID=A0A246JCW7_9BURK|nr:PHB depolymerase family esterase [Roseateles aquatilis]OWQ90449.1 phospholipase [Roseateles aquatilis]